ncbi:MAG: FtsW/RodA/SpoVE family cell cycle protein [Acetobacteraceae bacterium]|nr:FtsW/RodA/SpoVE family cell cycle protein [Acetobacteraceae bacterium]
MLVLYLEGNRSDRLMLVYGLATVAAFLAISLYWERSGYRADPYLLPVVSALTATGLVFLYRLYPVYGARQFVWLIFGLAALALTTRFLADFRFLSDYKYVYALAGLLVLILPVFFGKEQGGAKSWLSFGAFSVQPSEFVKILVVLFLASFLSENRAALSAGTRLVGKLSLPGPQEWGPLAGMWGISLMLLVYQRDLGTALIYFSTFLAMVYAATARVFYVLFGLGLFVAGAAASFFLFGHVRERVEIWLNPWPHIDTTGYQVIQSLFAIGSGGITGTGLGQGYPKFIPAVHTDFIFSAICEEMGLLGGAGVVLLYMVCIFRGIKIALNAGDDFEALAAAGLTALLGLQAFTILAGVTGLLPLTGVTLPYISYGGSSLVANFILLGLRGQAKSRILRMLTAFLDEEIPVVAGSEVNDDPFRPISKYGRVRVQELGDDTPIEWLPRDARYVEKLATPDVTIADLLGDLDPIRAARQAKEAYPEALVVLGGAHPTALPERTLAECPEADVVVRGEGEEALLELARLACGPARRSSSALAGVAGIAYRGPQGPVLSPARQPIFDLDRLPFPAWELFELDRYTRVLLERFGLEAPLFQVAGSRGCPYGCVFCFPLLGRSCRFRSPASVAEEMAHGHRRFGARHFDFTDSTATLDRGRFLALCAELEARGLEARVSWNFETRVDLVDEEVLARARRAGAEMVCFGVESGDDRVLRRVSKGVTVEKAEAAVAAAARCGLKVKLSFILGHPYETRASALRTLDFARRLRQLYGVDISLNLIDAYPGTEFYAMVDRGEGGARWVPGARDNWAGYCRSRPMVEVNDLDADGLEGLYRGFVEELQRLPARRFYQGAGWAGSGGSGGGEPGRSGPGGGVRGDGVRAEPGRGCGGAGAPPDPGPAPEVVVVGIGYGAGGLTQEVEEVLRSAAVVTGHELIVDQVRSLLRPGVLVLPDRPDRERSATLRELKARRVARAVAAAREYGRVVYVSSGDPGIYSYAQPLIEGAAAGGVKVRVLPGLTAASVLAASLGAPLREGYALVGLCDQKVPEEVALGRVRAAAAADMVVVLYLPVHEALLFPDHFPPSAYPEVHPIPEQARRRLRLAIDILLQNRPPDTPAVVGDLGQEPLKTCLGDLGGLLDRVQPYSTLMVGNSRTRWVDGYLVTSDWEGWGPGGPGCP